MRLIDADALYKDIIRSMDYCDDILEIIEKQPTIKRKKRESQKRYQLKYYRKTAYAKRHYERWTIEEDTLVILHNVTDYELSDIIGRSVNAIQHRRNRLKENPEQFEISLQKLLKTV